MKLIMTMMVRDEADILESMLQFHLRQGVDFFVITDNGSVDGTSQIIQKYVEEGLVDFRVDPVHAKQQGATVTKMARDAFLLHQADWVINADADEFWLPVDRRRNLKQVFENFSTSWQSFTVEVTDMIGSPAKSGTGLSRLSYIDKRTNEELSRVGLRAHSTHNAVHIGSADIEVSQGNHFVSLESRGRPESKDDLQVLHFQWRSWEQFRQKVFNAGSSYENSELKPSPNHHGMLDYRRLNEGTLEAWYVARHPKKEELGSEKFPKLEIKNFPESVVADVDYEETRETELRNFGKALAQLRFDLLSAQELAKSVSMKKKLIAQQQAQIADLDQIILELNATLKNPFKQIRWLFTAIKKKIIAR